MGMRLLKKQEVTAAKAKEQHQAVNEGLKLAKRVDALREVGAQEEAALEQFRVKTIETIGKDIAAREAVRDALIVEVQLLESRRADALIPLDNYKSELYTEALRLEQKDADLTAIDVELGHRAYELSHREFAATKKEHNNNVVHNQVEAMFQEASTLKVNAVKEAVRAAELLRTAEVQAKTSADNIAVREGFVEKREARVAEAEEANRIKEIELAKEWSRLQDAKATHERTIKRDKQ